MLKPQCLVQNCQNNSHIKGYCPAHYYRYKRYGDPHKGIKETHGASHTREYKSYVSMRNRCLNKNADHYESYGGRGIKIDERWSTFSNFLADMGPRPKGMSLERKDVNGDYTPDNCVWATQKVQGANQRIRRTNTSGFTGVAKADNRWRAQITVNYKIITLGRFDTPEEASAWRDAYIIANDLPHKLNFMEQTA